MSTIKVVNIQHPDSVDPNLVLQSDGDTVGSIAFATSQQEAFRVDSEGRLLVGTSTALSNVSIGGTLAAPAHQIQGATGGVSGASITRTTAGSAYFTLNAGSTGNNVASNNGLGVIQFNGFDGTNYINGASIRAAVDGTPGTDDMPGRLVFSTTADGASSPTERLRINSEGRLLVGTSSSIGVGSPTSAQLQISSGSGGINAALYGLTDSAFGSVFVMGHGRSTTSGALLQNDRLGEIRFAGADGTDLQTIGATIKAEVDGTPGANDMPGRLLFSTTADGASTSTERMRITSSGNVGIGATSNIESRLHLKHDSDSLKNMLYFQNRNAGANAGSQIAFSNATNDLSDNRFAFIRGLTSGAGQNGNTLTFGTNPNGAAPVERMRITNAGKILVGTTVAVAANSTTTNNSGLTITSDGGILAKTTPTIGSVFFEQNVTGYTSGIVVYQRFRVGGTSIGNITTSNGTTISYNSFSDYRLKKNVTPVTDGITRLQQLKPSRFNFIADPDTVVDGFLAHEVQTIVPEAITGEKDAVDDDGNPEYQGIDQSKLVPLLTAALQEAIAKIETLEQRLSDAGIA